MFVIGKRTKKMRWDRRKVVLPPYDVVVLCTRRMDKLERAGGKGTPAAISSKVSAKKSGAGVTRRVSAAPSVTSGWHTSICLAVAVVVSNKTESV